MIALTIVAKVKAQPGAEFIVREALLQLIPLTLAEAGCLNYDLHRSIEEPTLFLFYENWFCSMKTGKVNPLGSNIWIQNTLRRSKETQKI